MVTRLLSHGWLEEYTMGVLRSKMVERLRTADVEGRFNVYYPDMPGLAEGTCVDVHSKMMAVDDEWLRIGSANINNRSMGVDTECDLAIEASGRNEVARVIRNFRDDLLAEHLGVTREEVERETKTHGSIAGAVSALERPGRTLKRLQVESHSDITLSIAEMTDPEQAVGVDKLMALFLVRCPVPYRATAPAQGRAIHCSGRSSVRVMALHTAERRVARQPWKVGVSVSVEKTAALGRVSLVVATRPPALKSS